MQRSDAVSLRPLSADDLPSVLKIEEKCYPMPWTRGNFEAELAKPYCRALVLTDDETDSVILGYIIYWIQAEGASLMNVTVHPEWRGMGFAQILLHAMINEVVRDEIPKITLEVRKSNAGAIRLYEKLKFRRVHERKKFYQDGETAVVMEMKTSDLSGVIQ